MTTEVLFSESGIDALVRSGGWRRLRRFAGRTGAANVAFRGITPDPTTAIQAGVGSAVGSGGGRAPPSVAFGGFAPVRTTPIRAVVGSAVDAGQAEGIAQSRTHPSD